MFHYVANECLGGGLSLTRQSGADSSLICKGKIFSKGFVARESVLSQQHLKYHLSSLESLRHARGAMFGGNAENDFFLAFGKRFCCRGWGAQKRAIKSACLMIDDRRKCAGGATKSLLVVAKGLKKFGKPTLFSESAATPLG